MKSLLKLFSKDSDTGPFFMSSCGKLNTFLHIYLVSPSHSPRHLALPRTQKRNSMVCPLWNRSAATKWLKTNPKKSQKHDKNKLDNGLSAVSTFLPEEITPDSFLNLPFRKGQPLIYYNTKFLVFFFGDIDVPTRYSDGDFFKKSLLYQTPPFTSCYS